MLHAPEAARLAGDIVAAPHAAPHPVLPAGIGQIVLVLQGGGALGAYQAGVYQALSEARVEPDWVIGTSIGAINASLIAGSPRGERVERLREFWRRVETGRFMGAPLPAWFGAAARNLLAVTTGVPSFF